MSASPSTPLCAYRPLRARSLLAQLAALVPAEALLFASYRSHESGFHWATHLLVGVAAAALWNLGWLALKRAPAPAQLLSVLVAHLLAMFPDFLFSAGVPHYAWMDVFLAHNSSHHLPGGAFGWLVIALTLSGLYAAALSWWLHTRADDRR
jgi:hypothetical protein